MAENFKLSDMVKGWFVGQFVPTAFKSDACEVAVKTYQKGDYEPEHYHKIATEITLILSGEVMMLGKKWSDGDIIVIHPNESTDFEALSNVTTIVVKIPGAIDDKYHANDA